LIADTGDSLTSSFFSRPVLTVARDLLGTVLVTASGARVRIVETEAYGGTDDPASHAGRGPTRRSEVMFGPPGFAYVYLVYGVHHCLNLVTGPAGDPSAVLIRAAEPLAGVAPRPDTPAHRLCAGPGLLCRSLGIDLNLNGAPVAADLPGAGALRLLAGGEPGPVVASGRIGIRRATRRQWRFTMAGNPGLSR